MDIILSKEEVYFAITGYLLMKGFSPNGTYNLRVSKDEGLIHIEATNVEQNGNVDLPKIVEIMRNKTF